MAEDPSSNSFRRLPIGAELHPQGGVHVRVWAPRCNTLEAVLEEPSGKEATALERDTKGYFSGRIPGAGEGTLYWFRLDRGTTCPDPASRFQPLGPQGPSQVVNPVVYSWKDGPWEGVNLEGQVIYEMHIGTFTEEGTWEAAIRYLPDLAETGMPPWSHPRKPGRSFTPSILPRPSRQRPIAAVSFSVLFLPSHR